MLILDYLCLLTTVLIYKPYSIILNRLIQRFSFFGFIDPSAELSNKAISLDSTFELDTLVLQFVARIQRKMQARVGAVYILQRQFNHLVQFFPKSRINGIWCNSELYKDLKKMNTNVLLPNDIMQLANTHMRLHRFLLRKKAQSCIIIFKKDAIQAVIIMREKKAQMKYSEKDRVYLSESTDAFMAELESTLYWHESVENLRMQLHEQEYNRR